MAKILLIEDDENARTLMAEVLTHTGHSVVQVGNGTRGMYEFHQSEPDLVVTDVIMAGQEGIETLQRIKKISPETPVMVISGGGVWNTTEYCLGIARKLGASCVLAKPFTRAMFLNRVQTLLREAQPTKL